MMQCLADVITRKDQSATFGRIRWLLIMSAHAYIQVIQSATIGKIRTHVTTLLNH